MNCEFRTPKVKTPEGTFQSPALLLLACRIREPIALPREGSRAALSNSTAPGLHLVMFYSTGNFQGLEDLCALFANYPLQAASLHLRFCFDTFIVFL